ncbi:MAG: T9SS type A sorting domain-containing protein [Chitinophagales bacterium]
MKDSDAFYVTGVTFDSNNVSFKNRVFVAKMNDAGDIIESQSFYNNEDKDYAAFHNTLIKNSRGAFLLTGYARNPSNKLFVAQFSTLDTVTVNEYYTPNTYLFAGMKMLQYSDGNYFITGVKTDSIQNNANVVLVKIDSSGNRLWEKVYNSAMRDYAQSITKLNNGNLLLGAFRSDINLTNEHANTWLIEVDTGGTLIRQWFDPSDSTYTAEGLLQTQDGGFIYGAQKKFIQIGNTVAYINTVVKMDSFFNKQWTFKTGYRSIYSGVSDIEVLDDGSFVACGQLFSLDYDTTVLYGWIVKLDIGGNVVWEKLYLGINASQTLNFLTDIDVLPDGSLIAVGQCQNPGQIPGQVGWFLKLDSNGCEVENCLVGIEDQPQAPEGGFNNQLQIQPNPASDRVWLEVEPGMLGGELKLYDISGRLMKKLMVEALQFVVEVSDLSKGVYVTTIEHEGVLGRGKLVKE